LGATVKHCSFHQQPQQCRQMINQWVSQKNAPQNQQNYPPRRYHR
jgi:serine protease inhibitor